MRVIMAQFDIRPEFVKAFEIARDRVLIALHHRSPERVRYTWCAIPDSTRFIGWLELEEGIENPLPETDAGREFMANIQSWTTTPPAPQELRFIGSYTPLTKG